MCEKGHCTPLTALQQYCYLPPYTIQLTLACHFTNYKETITIFMVLLTSAADGETKSSTTHSETRIKSMLVGKMWISSSSFRISHSISRGTLTKCTSLSEKTLIMNSPTLIKLTAANQLTNSSRDHAPQEI